MLKINKIYTKGGDRGETHTACLKRIQKGHNLIEIIGKLDNLNATFGEIRSKITNTYSNLSHIDPYLKAIQQDLFNMGALLATLDPEQYPKRKPINPSRITEIEQLIDTLNENLPELTSFILPGGHPVASSFHLARTVCRELEHLLWKYQQDYIFNDTIVQYINRLSDLMFVYSRKVNKDTQQDEELWILK